MPHYLPNPPPKDCDPAAALAADPPKPPPPNPPPNDWDEAEAKEEEPPKPPPPKPGPPPKPPPPKRLRYGTK